MSTRALYVFKEKDKKFVVYKHYDGYPSKAWHFINNALPFAWELPRFEADDFAAAFVSANKEGGGDIRLTNNDDECDRGQEYVYEITFADYLMIRVFEVIFSLEYPDKQIKKELFYGNLAKMKIFVKHY